MKFTIGTVSTPQNLSEVSNLIKSSILYADEVELIGLTEYALYAYLPRLLGSNKRIDAKIADLLPFLKSLNFPNKEDMIQQLEYAQNQLNAIAPHLNRRKYRSKAEILAQMKIGSVSAEFNAQLQTALEQLISDPLSAEIQKLVQNDIISVFDYNSSGLNTDELAGGYFSVLMRAIYTGGSFPLFDDTSKGIISSVAKTNLLDIHFIKPEVLRHAGVATNILMTLPTLSEATFDELLDLKKQNQGPLSRYRTAIYGFADQIASLPWDDDFEYECIKLYDTEVAPQVAEINEILTDTSVLKNLGKRVLADEEIRKKVAFAAGGLTTAITGSNGFVNIFRSVVMAAGLATLSTEAASGFLRTLNLYAESRSEVESKKKQAQKNVMYYYYLAGKL